MLLQKVSSAMLLEQGGGHPAPSDQPTLLAWMPSLPAPGGQPGSPGLSQGPRHPSDSASRSLGWPCPLAWVGRVGLPLGALQRHSTNDPAPKALATIFHWPGGLERLEQGQGGSQQVLWYPVSREGTCILTPLSVSHVQASQTPALSARASLSQSLVATWFMGERSRSRVGLRCHGLAPTPSLRVLERPRLRRLPFCVSGRGGSDVPASV